MYIYNNEIYLNRLTRPLVNVTFTQLYTYSCTRAQISKLYFVIKNSLRQQGCPLYPTPLLLSLKSTSLLPSRQVNASITLESLTAKY